MTAFILLSTNAYSQGEASGNTFLGSFLGWNNTNGTNPLFFRTNDVNRMKINGNLNYTINGYDTARNGNILIGVNNNSMAGSGSIYTNTGAFSPNFRNLAIARGWMQELPTATFPI